MKFYLVLATLFTIFTLESDAQIFAFFSKKKKEGKNKSSYLDRQNKRALANLIVERSDMGCSNNEIILNSIEAGVEGNDRFLDAKVLVLDSLEIPVEYLLTHTYFQVWDSKSLNPYQTTVEAFDEYQKIKLRDSSRYASGGFTYPLEGKHHVTSEYGIRKWKFHHGVDLRVKVGDAVKSCFDGVVRISKYNRSGYGNYVVVRHSNGLETLYGHLDQRKVQVGQVVKAGEVVGLAGNTGRSTGPHLHFEVRYAGLDINPERVFKWSQPSHSVPVDLVVSSESFPEYKDYKKARYHKIRRGDSLWLLARKYGTSITKICRLNGISRKTVLRVGRRLRVR